MATSTFSLPTFPPFDAHADGNTGQRWKKWLSRFERLLIAMNIEEKKQQRAMLLHFAGPAVDEIFETLPDTGEAKDYDKAVEALNAYFIPQTNTAYEEYNFRQAKQRDNETLDTYHTRLRQLSQNCSFADVDKEIKNQIIIGCLSQKLRRRALRDNPTLKELLDAGRAEERSQAQAKTVEKQQSFQDINAITSARDKDNPSRRDTKKFQNQRQSPSNTRYQQHHSKNLGQPETCRNCGGVYPHIKDCPAKGKECHSCKKIGHFSKVCRSSNKPKPARNRLHNVSNAPIDDPDYIFTLTNNTSNTSQPPQCEVLIETQPVNVIIDSGASVNIIDEHTFKLLARKNGHLRLRQPESNIFPYGSNYQLPILGMITAAIQFQSTSLKSNFYIAKGSSGNLLSCQTAERLGILKITINTAISSPNHIEDEFQDLFGGIGKIKNSQVQLHIDTDITPKQQKHRRIPFHIRKDVERELQRLEDLDIIEKVDGPTPWISPIVVVPKKNGETRLCVDMREANKAVRLEKHPMPTIDELITDLNGATVFTTLDLTSGYHQLELHPESRHITTFTTHVGLRRYKRLIFGINAASEIFQNEIAKLLVGLPGCKNISDDIIVYGRDEKEHDENLRRVLTRLEENNAKLNREKCSFRQRQVVFFGHTFSSNGVQADPEKIDTIKKMQPPKNVSEMKSLLGMTQYVSRFIPNYASITTPLRTLTHQNVPWKWQTEQENALKKLQHELTSDHVMAYFDASKPTTIIVDASPFGLGALLTQDGRVISYASRALSSVESRYSQTEREMLAVIWAIEHYHLYLYGAKFTVITDHKPLLGIFKSQKPTSARIDRWKLRLMPYDCEILYKPGKDAENPADFISRHPNNLYTPPAENATEAYVNYLCNNLIPKAMTIDEVQQETANDTVLCKLSEAIAHNNWLDPEVKPFLNVKDELSVCNGLILRNHRLVLPHFLQTKAVDLAHTGHQGIVKTKMLLREKVWFPSIDKLVEEKVKTCLPCQAATTGTSTNPEPLIMTKLPDAPWQEVAADFVGPFPSGELLLVVIDEFSRFPEVEIINSTSAKTVIPKLDNIFSRQGVPCVLKTDNGPPFNSSEFEQFANYLGFKHRKVTPYWPKANGEAERFMRTLEKSIRTAHIENKNRKQALYEFLRQYRATPHSTTNISPAEALNNRKLKIPLPSVVELPQQKTHDPLRQRDLAKKEKMKEDADKRQHSKTNDLKVGDTVLIRQPKKNKLSPLFDPKPFTVEARKGTMVTAKRDSHTITRNVSFFKKISGLQNNTSADEDESDDDDVPMTSALTRQEQDRQEPARPRRSERNRRQPNRFGY